MARKIEQIKRKRNIRLEKECILFNFEGNNKTEEIYFNNFQDRKNKYYIKSLNSHITDALQMVEVLVDYMKKESINVNDNYKVYCVFDTDISLEKQNRIDAAIKLAKDNNIVPIISTPCFEIWYRLHFSYTKKNYNSGNELIKELKKYIPYYEKNIDVYKEIKENTKIAIRNSKKLEEQQLRDGKVLTSTDCNPYTEVYKVVEYLLDK